MSGLAEPSGHISGSIRRVKLYKVVVWLEDGKPGTRMRVWAENEAEAGAKLTEQYGEGHTYTLANDEDAATPR